MRPFSRTLSLLGALLLITAVASAALASEPPSHEGVEVPTAVGEVVEVEWTGLMPPGANQFSDCDATPVHNAAADHHTIELVVPEGTYDEISVQATFYLEYDGQFVDAILTVITPDDSHSADGGFVQTDESIGLNKPVAGTYEVLACMFAGANPQSYTGRLVLEGLPLLPNLATGTPCADEPAAPKFEEAYVDETRAGGEPMITTHPDGTLLWGSHAGSTHFYAPGGPDPQTAAFVQNYVGQTYQYWSDDGGVTWNFVQRATPTGGNVPGSGFSDPEFAIDAAGNVFVSEINLANVAVSKSSDSGRSYTLQNVTGFTMTDRQWTAADAEDVLYMTGNAIFGGTFPGSPAGTSGHILAKSIDGGETFTQPEIAKPGGVADIQINPETGDLYELSESGGTLSMGVYRGIRGVDEGPFADLLELNPIAEGAGLSGIGRLIDPTFDMDSEGNLYFVWTENGTGARATGIYYSYSTDDARTWAAPIRVDTDSRSEAWPWIAVGDPGQIAIAYLHTNEKIENNNAEEAPLDTEWDVMVATSDTALGCADSPIPGFTHTIASAERVHTGTICMGGTACQTDGRDRRLGDYFSNEVDLEGNMLIAVSDTRQGGAVSLPLVIRQVGGPKLRGGGKPPYVQPTPTPTPSASPSVAPTGGGTASPSVSPSGATGTTGDTGSTPQTGSGMAAAGLGLLLVGAAAARGARRRGR